MTTDPGLLPPYDWPGRPRFGPGPGTSREAAGTAPQVVVLSWHVAPNFDNIAGQDRTLAIWAEPLLDALIEAGARVTLLLAFHGAAATLLSGDPATTPLGGHLAQRGVALRLVGAATPLDLALGVDAALVALAPDLVHAPERRGVLAVALARRAAGLAHVDTTMLLHARGSTMVQMEEQARFIAAPEVLVFDELERQAMRLADAVLTASAEQAAALPAARLVAPLVWPVPPVAPAAITELVFPLPLDSESGLEFAVAALARAAAKAPFPLAVTFLGQPGHVTIGNAAQALAGLAPAGPRLDWRVLVAETPQRAILYLARPGRMALFTATTTPPEWLELCGAAGIPVLATANRNSEAAAARWPCLRVAPRAERSFAATLAALAKTGAATTSAAPLAPLPLPSPSPVLGWRPQGLRAIAWLAEPATPLLTVFCGPRISLLASLAGQQLPSFATTLMLDEAEALPATPPRPAARPLAVLQGGTAALPRALAECGTRYAVLCGDARALRPTALAALQRAAMASDAVAITAWDSSGGQPIGGGGDLALLRPGETLGHLVLLDLPALRDRGGHALVAAGTPGFAAALAVESGGVMMLPEILAEALDRPAPPARPSAALLPARLAGLAGMALYYAAPHAAPLAAPPTDPLDPTAAMAVANRESTHYLKLLGRFMDRSGQREAAADAWAALLARQPDDGEAWVMHARHALRRHRRIPQAAALEAFVLRHGLGPIQGLVEAVAETAQGLTEAGQGAEGMAMLVELAPALQASEGFIAALARAYARLPGEQRWPGALPGGLRPAGTAALRDALAEYGLAGDIPGAEDMP